MATGGDLSPYAQIRRSESGGTLHPVLQRARNGDPEALEEFLTEARKVVLAVVRRRLRGGWTGDYIPDVIQDSLVDVLRSYGECQATSEGGVRAWIQAIARREVIELFRRGPCEGCEISPEWAEACLRAVPEKLYHLGLSGGVARNTLAVANAKRDWRIYAGFAQEVIAQGRRLYAEEDLGLELDQTVYALDSTTIELCLSLFPWARVGRDRGSVKVHTLLDLQGNIPANRLLAVSNGLKVGELAMHEVDHGGEVAGGAEASGASLGGLDEGREAFEEAV